MMTMKHLMQRPLISGMAILMGLAIAAGLSAATLGSSPADRIRISASRPSYSLADLERASEAIAVVEFQATDRVFWNSRANARWQPEVASGKLALIYRDDVFNVLETLKGALPASLIIRGVGGQIDNVRMDYEGQVDWQVGSRYLLFLRKDDTPFDVGTERVWTIVWTGSGSFAQRADRWINADGILNVTVDDVVRRLE